MDTKQRVETLGNDLKSAGRKVWLAGLGAASSVEEGGRKLFDQLVERGERRRTESPLTQPIQQAGDRVKKLSARLEDRIETGFSSTLHRLGVPARGDVQGLTDRIEELTRKVEALASN